jgi:hypothetical protein
LIPLVGLILKKGITEAAKASLEEALKYSKDNSDIKNHIKKVMKQQKIFSEGKIEN